MNLVLGHGALVVMKAKLSIIITILSIILVLSIVTYADSGTFYVSNGTTNLTITSISFPCTGTLSTYYTLDYPIYGDVNVAEKIELTYTDEYGDSIEAVDTQIVLYLNESWYNFTYINASNVWRIYLRTENDEDIHFNISMYSPSYTCINTSGLIQFRTPYYLTIHFFKAKDQTTIDVEPYKNEFQYIFLQNYSQMNQMNTFVDLSYLDDWFGWMPFYTKGQIGRKKNTDLSFWAKYEDGSAVIKLYETGNYSLNILQSNVQGLPWTEEFTFPQFDPKWKINRLDTGLIIKNASSMTVNVYATLWEVNKSRLMRDWFFYAVAIALYFVVLFIMLSAGVHDWRVIIGLTIGYVTLLKVIGWIWL